MGQAKQRGTFEQRQAEGIAKKLEQQRKIEQQRKLDAIESDRLDRVQGNTSKMLSNHALFAALLMAFKH